MLTVTSASSQSTIETALAQWLATIADERRACGVYPIKPSRRGQISSISRHHADSLIAMYTRYRYHSLDLAIDMKLAATQLDKPIAFMLVANTDCFPGDALSHFGGIYTLLNQNYPIDQRDMLIPNSMYFLDGTNLSHRLRTPTPMSAEGLALIAGAGLAALMPTDQHWTDGELRAVHGQPCGYMANTAEPGEDHNARIDYLESKYPIIVATAPIARGTRIVVQRLTSLGAQNTFQMTGAAAFNSTLAHDSYFEPTHRPGTFSPSAHTTHAVATSRVSPPRSALRQNALKIATAAIAATRVAEPGWYRLSLSAFFVQSSHETAHNHERLVEIILRLGTRTDLFEQYAFQHRRYHRTIDVDEKIKAGSHMSSVIKQLSVIILARNVLAQWTLKTLQKAPRGVDIVKARENAKHQLDSRIIPPVGCADPLLPIRHLCRCIWIELGIIGADGTYNVDFAQYNIAGATTEDEPPADAPSASAAPPACNHTILPADGRFAAVNDIRFINRESDDSSIDTGEWRRLHAHLTSIAAARVANLLASTNLANHNAGGAAAAANRLWGVLAYRLGELAGTISRNNDAWAPLRRGVNHATIQLRCLLNPASSSPSPVVIVEDDDAAVNDEHSESSEAMLDGFPQYHTAAEATIDLHERESALAELRDECAANINEWINAARRLAIAEHQRSTLVDVAEQQTIDHAAADAAARLNRGEFTSRRANPLDPSDRPRSVSQQTFADDDTLQPTKRRRKSVSFDSIGEEASQATPPIIQPTLTPDVEPIWQQLAVLPHLPSPGIDISARELSKQSDALHLMMVFIYSHHYDLRYTLVDIVAELAGAGIIIGAAPVVLVTPPRESTPSSSVAASIRRFAAARAIDVARIDVHRLSLELKAERAIVKAIITWQSDIAADPSAYESPIAASAILEQSSARIRLLHSKHLASADHFERLLTSPSPISTPGKSPTTKRSHSQSHSALRHDRLCC